MGKLRWNSSAATRVIFLDTAMRSKNYIMNDRRHPYCDGIESSNEP